MGRRGSQPAPWPPDGLGEPDAAERTVRTARTERTFPPQTFRRRRPLGRIGRAGVDRLSGRVRSMFDTGGPGFRNLAFTHGLSTAADTLVAIGLAGTLFFSVPSAEARTNVVLYLLLTVAPFAVIGPTLGRLLDRAPASTRTVLVSAAAGRGILALSLIATSGTIWLLPAAFGLLVLSRVHIITRNSLLPLALDEPRRLVEANARLAWIGMLTGGLGAGLGVAVAMFADVQGPLLLAGVVALGAALLGRRLPAPDGSGIHPVERGARLPELHFDRSVHMARLATAGVRAFNGFVVLLLAFALREVDASIADFGALLGAMGGGYAVASRVVPAMSRRVSEEPMVVAALSITAVAAFAAGQWFGMTAAAITAGLAGFAWGTAKLAFDGLLQSQVPAERRGAAFTRSETMFSIAFVVGAIVPTAIPMPVTLGLVLTGFGALAAQIVYVAALLVPPAPVHDRGPTSGTRTTGDAPETTDASRRTSRSVPATHPEGSTRSAAPSRRARRDATSVGEAATPVSEPSEPGELP